MSLCLHCDDEFVDRERRGRREYIGYYCAECVEFQAENGRLPQEGE